MLPKAGNYTAVVAVVSVLALLLVIAQVVTKPAGFAIGWALWLVLAFTLLQAVAAVAALLFESGVITPPAPRPRYESYGQYGPPRATTASPGRRARRNAPATRRSTAAATSSGPGAGGFTDPARRAVPHPADRFPELQPAAPVGSGQQPGSGQPGQQSSAPSTAPPSGPNPS